MYMLCSEGLNFVYIYIIMYVTTGLSGRQSGFPNTLEWAPKARQMTERERMLLNGPSNSIRVSVQNDKTGRIITNKYFPSSFICSTSTPQ